MNTLKITAIIILLAAAGCATEPVPDSQKPGAVASSLALITATVDAIDKSTRMVRLRGETGRTVTIKVDDLAHNFDQIEVGDRLDVEYYESVALFVRSGGGSEPDIGGASAVAIAPEGEKPGVAAVETVIRTAKVIHISHPRRLIEIERADGSTETLRVSDQVKDFDKIRAGDEIVVRHTVAIAIEVKPAKIFD